jgi:hypothetical protein
MKILRSKELYVYYLKKLNLGLLWIFLKVGCINWGGKKKKKAKWHPIKWNYATLGG